MNLSVRELEYKDIPTIVDYFLNAKSDFLQRMGIDTSKLLSRDEWLKLLYDEFEIEIKKSTFTNWL